MALVQIGTTMVPLLLLIIIMHVGIANGWWSIVPLLALPAAALTVRTFIIQHDCGHASFLPSRRFNDVVGRFCSAFTLTPYNHWRHQHAQHHGKWNNLDRRGDSINDIYSNCLTVEEYRSMRRWSQNWYRWLRHPVISLVLLPPVIFLLLYRVTFDRATATWSDRTSVYLTNLFLITLYGGLAYLLGVGPVLLVLLSVMLPASIIGVWLFSLQHQFELSHWERQDNWNVVTAAMEGCSFLRLPGLLQWITGNIGFHHVHHLAPRIPNYMLAACHHAHPAFSCARTLTLREGLRANRYVLWDEAAHRMRTFAELRGLPTERGGGCVTGLIQETSATNPIREHGSAFNKPSPQLP